MLTSTTPVTQYSLSVAEKIHPDAVVFLEHGTFFVGIQYEQGRLILGHGETVKQAVDAAVARFEG